MHGGHPTAHFRPLFLDAAPARTRTATAMCWPTSRGVTRRPSGPAWRSSPTGRTGPTASWPRSTTAATWSGATLRMVDRNVAFTAVRASRGKIVRAEPVAALYDQGRVHHIGIFPQLEDQMTNFTSDIDRAAAGYSPDRVDALVWAFSELLVEPMNGEGLFEFTASTAKPPRSAASHNPLKPCPSLARWSGSRRRRTRAEPSGGIVSTAFVPRYQ
jgi:hypothetical protein